MSSATHTQGIRLQRGDGGGTEVFTTIAEVTNFTGPTETARQVDVTNFDSTAREYIGGLRDAGEISFDFNFIGNNAQQQGLRADLIARTQRNFKLLLNDHATTPTTVAFAAIVTSFSMNGTTDDVVKGHAALKITGAPTITYAP